MLASHSNSCALARRRADGAETQFPGAVDRKVNAAASDFAVIKKLHAGTAL